MVKLILLAIAAISLLGLLIMMVIRLAQWRHLQEVIHAEGLLREAKAVPTALNLATPMERWTRVNLYLSRKRICALPSFWSAPLVRLTFENMAMEILLTVNLDRQQRPYLSLADPTQQAEISFFLPDAREWLCEIERLSNHCDPANCANFDPALCAGGECTTGVASTPPGYSFPV
jgi:hypothetical protein